MWLKNKPQNHISDKQTISVAKKQASKLFPWEANKRRQIAGCEKKGFKEGVTGGSSKGWFKNKNWQHSTPENAIMVVIWHESCGVLAKFKRLRENLCCMGQERSSNSSFVTEVRMLNLCCLTHRVHVRGEVLAAASHGCGGQGHQDKDHRVPHAAQAGRLVTALGVCLRLYWPDWMLSARCLLDAWFEVSVCTCSVCPVSTLWVVIRTAVGRASKHHPLWC